MLAVFADQPGHSNTMLASMECLAGCLVGAQPIESDYVPMLRLPHLDDTLRRAELKKFLRFQPGQAPKPTPEQSEDSGELNLAFTEPEKGHETPTSAFVGAQALSHPVAFPMTQDLPDAQPIWFFMSYAAADRDPYFRELYEVLVQSVVRITGVSTAAGFFDARDLSTGNPWSKAISAALARTRTFVPLLTPSYFRSEFCGKEWQAFSFRETLRPGRWSRILPILWEFGEGLPPIASHLQLSLVDFPSEYQTLGLRALMRRRRYLGAYRSFVDTFASKLVEIAQEDPLPPLEGGLDLDTVPNAFASQPLRLARQEPNARVIYLVGTRDEMRSLRKDQVRAYGNSEEAWKPYGDEPIHQLCLAIASRMEMQLSVSEASAASLPESLSPPVITVIFVDVWSLFLPRIQNLFAKLQELGRRPNIAFLFIHDQDEDTASGKDELEDNLNKLMARPSPRVLAFEVIRSGSDLKQALAATFVKLQSSLIFSADPSRTLSVESPVPRLA